MFLHKSLRVWVGENVSGAGIARSITLFYGCCSGCSMMAEARMVTPKQRDCKRFILVLACSLALLMGSIVNGVTGPGETEQSCNALRSMARMHMALGNCAEAQPLAEQAMTLAKTDNASDSQLSLCLLDLAWLHKDQGRFAEA